MTVKKTIRAITAGIAVGIVFQESLWMALDLMDPRTSLNARMAVEGELAAAIAPAVLAWALGGFVGGLMSTLIAARRAHGMVTGIALSLSALLLIHLADPKAGSLLLMALVPATAALPGTWLAAACMPKEQSRKNSPGHVRDADRLRPHGMD